MPAPRQGYDIFMEAQPGVDAGDKLYLKVRSDTRIWVRSSTAKLSVGSLESVSVGSAIEVWLTGVILESYPAQAVADLIVVDASD